MSAPVNSLEKQQLHSETTNGQSPVSTNNIKNKSFSSSSPPPSSSSYPPPTAKYEDVVQSADLFWETLKAFHKSFGNKFKIPTVGGTALDLHRLFVEVTCRGGLEKVVRDRKWKEVIVVFKFPTTITSASFVLRKYYLSLLYHFEQVYYFRKQVPSISVHDALGGSLANESANLEEGTSDQGSFKLLVGSSVTGIIDGKFDNGYLVTVNLGSDQLKGVLYHTPHMPQVSQSCHTSTAPPHRHRKRSRLALRDPSRPKSNRSGYNFFFAEHYARLKPQYYGQEKVISKNIGHLWNNLTEAEKQVYQEKGLRDKERYRAEMSEYRCSYDPTPQ
ncbi:HMG_box domain-containing protein/ARID domain-containing protein [Cephalotus follicularis]|uniref:HMG_box domain-containing protein/ARID domain-containing protein n=1 Tax=Cephalotus follicularis TaxID=3775 RepID=A0A1Q3C3F5_CEPFO|nr:HMG_box domain-containing protein/ARID domain-containing protein [Cephalotus follicularis]